MMQMTASAALESIDPELVIIIPTYRHPVLLTEALDSALDQITDFPFSIVVVSDGCTFPETDVAATAFAFSDPRILYLRKPNGGPSSARNFAIDFALAQFPSMKAVYFLDSDNRLTKTALQTGYDVLRGNPELGWVYPNIDSFGISWKANYAVPYSPLLHVIHENFCDTGSFVNRTLLEAGVRFDENALNGYEDWDFWLQAISRGFRGKHAQFGFSYRQRPESRFREMNRMRGAMLEGLRQRHWAISSPRNLIKWEHEDNPRYLLVDADRRDYRAFTDPSVPGKTIGAQDFEADLWASLAMGDEMWTPAFFAFGSVEIIGELNRLGLGHNVFLLLERAARKAECAVLTLGVTPGAISVVVGKRFADPQGLPVLVLVTAKRLKEMLVAEDDGVLASFADAWTLNAAIEIRLRAPFSTIAIESPQDARETAVAAIGAWRQSQFADSSPARWAWRPQVLPGRDEYYDKLCEYLGTSELTPRIPKDGIDVGFILPIASYGGAEKVGYALAQVLRRRGGVRTHLFVLGAAKMNIVSEYVDAFDSINFLAEPDFPVWGGPTTSFGQSIFLPGAPELKTEMLTGLLAGLDLAINCQSAPANSIMGSLRRMKVKTIAYLHLIDYSAHQRPVGHAHIAIGFEHAYDLLVTCSRRLADELHMLGAPSDKVMPIANAASFEISEALRDRARKKSITPREKRPLRCLYLGRLDHQKGVERLYGCIERLRGEGAPLEFQVVGSTLLNKNAIDWPQKFEQLGVVISPPKYASAELAELYLWADVLLLPSRWEGAPLVIPECQQLGCIPLCANVGAVDELIDDNRDGLLVADGADELVAADMAGQVRRVIADDDLRKRLARAGIERGVSNQWEENFAPLVGWIQSSHGCG